MSRIAAAFLFLFLVAWFLQYLGKTWSGELNVGSDDPAHYISGLMIHDYIGDGFPTTPLKFAETFYAHYPKVAIGHWPPAFYLLQAFWMLIFGGSIHSDLVFMAFLCALLAATLYQVIQREFGAHAIGIAGGLLFLSIPLVRLYGGTVMADLPVSLFCFWATLYWARYLDSGRQKYAIAFSALAALAILTKGNGFALLLVPPATILLGRRFELVKNWRLWLSGSPILLCLPWSLLTRGLVTPTMQYRASWQFFARAIRFYSANLLTVTGVFICLLSVLGVLSLIPALKNRTIPGLWLSLLALLAATLLFHSVVPAGLEPRYLLMVIPCIVLFTVRGAKYLVSQLSFVGSNKALRIEALLVSVGAALALASPTDSARPRGFAEAAACLTSRSEFAQPVILVSSEDDGEGPLIARIAELDQPRPNHIVLRASRTLADSDWNGRDYRLRLHTPDQVENYLESVPVSTVVIDRTNYALPNSHQPLLEEAIAANAQKWRFAGVFPSDPAQRQGQGVAVYSFTGVVRTHSIMLDAGGTLKRTIVIDPSRRPW